ncbi:AHH domain-containing protein [Flavobacterium sp. Fl-318]|uniref:AHH domain-containing protein n=2 Tax=Flavobacterium cupriresistens TaxID=2893885 RepID=A0ABU4R803_9FLAO|nr:AHH domain-containing protein [Flavobacterium sp. Fl-318]MDX6187749.1 AHH domain-containing protein [Flavobacterium sp. Fl-318]
MVYVPGLVYQFDENGELNVPDFDSFNKANGATTAIGGPYDVTGFWEAFFTQLFTEMGDDSPQASIALAVITKGKVKPKNAIILLENLPKQMHHFATNKNKNWTPLMNKIAQKYGLSLNGSWNKALMPHLGRHPNDYHKFVYKAMQEASAKAGNNKEQFIKLFNESVTQPVLQNPGLLRKSGWQ